MVAGRFFLETILTTNWDEFLSILWWSLNPSILIIAIVLLFFRLYWGNISITKRALRPGIIKTMGRRDGSVVGESRAWFTEPASYVGWVCCWFSFRSREENDPQMHGHFWTSSCELLGAPWVNKLYYILRFRFLSETAKQPIFSFFLSPRAVKIGLTSRTMYRTNPRSRSVQFANCSSSPFSFVDLQRSPAKKCIVWPVLSSSRWG